MRKSIMLSGSFKQRNLLQVDSFFKSKQCLLSYHFLISHLWRVFVKKKKKNSTNSDESSNVVYNLDFSLVCAQACHHNFIKVAVKTILSLQSLHCLPHWEVLPMLVHLLFFQNYTLFWVLEARLSHISSARNLTFTI